MSITDFTKDGKCSSCGQCCSDVLPVAKHELERIRSYVQKHGIKECKHFAASGKYDLTCPFRDDAKRICTIYEVRPSICREFKCDHTEEDIKRAKLDYHIKHHVVSMRSEFFGNNVLGDMLKSMFVE